MGTLPLDVKGAVQVSTSNLLIGPNAGPPATNGAVSLDYSAPDHRGPVMAGHSGDYREGLRDPDAASVGFRSYKVVESP